MVHPLRPLAVLELVAHQAGLHRFHPGLADVVVALLYLRCGNSGAGQTCYIERRGMNHTFYLRGPLCFVCGEHGNVLGKPERLAVVECRLISYVSYRNGTPLTHPMFKNAAVK